MSTNLSYAKESIYHDGVNDDAETTSHHWGYYLSTSSDHKVVTFIGSHDLLLEFEKAVDEWLKKNYPKIGPKDDWDAGMIAAYIASYAWMYDEDEVYVVDVTDEHIHGKIKHGEKFHQFIEVLQKVDRWDTKSGVTKVFEDVWKHIRGE